MSTSKQFTGLAVLLAVRDGDLDLSDDIRRWVPELPDYGRPPVRLGQMLHHRSGLPDYIGLMEDAGFGYRDRTTTQDALDALAAGPGLDFDPGSSWSNSNRGYFLLGVALEQATGLPLPDYLAEQVFAPLDLAMDPVTPIDGEAASCERAGDGWAVADSRWEQLGDGAIQTTPSELVRWAGFSTEFLVDPSRRVAVAISCNRPDLPDRVLALLDLWTRSLA